MTQRLGPYELNNIYCGECSQMMAGLPDECIDLTVTSPPYDNLRTYNGYTFDFEPIAQQLWRITKPGGVVVWVVGDATIDGSETCTSDIQKLYFRGLGFNVHDTMIYQKINGAIGSNSTYLQEYEFMLVLSKGKPKSVNFIRDRRNIETGNESVPKKKSDINGTVPDRKMIKYSEFGRRKNIWAYSVGGQQEIGYHPAPFPEALARDHIISWSNPGDIVFDPMVGSGTTCKMAKELGRCWLGFDISQKYVDLARRRVELARVSLFVEQPANGTSQPAAQLSLNLPPQP